MKPEAIYMTIYNIYVYVYELKADFKYKNKTSWFQYFFVLLHFFNVYF